MIEIRDATAELLQTRAGNEPLPRTARLVAALRDGKVVGIAGIYPDAARLVMFSDVDPDVWMDKRAIMRAARRILQLARRHRLPVQAAADPKADGSERFLMHLGFERIQDNIYQLSPGA